MSRTDSSISNPDHPDSVDFLKEGVEEDSVRLLLNLPRLHSSVPASRPVFPERSSMAEMRGAQQGDGVEADGDIEVGVRGLSDGNSRICTFREI